MTSNSNSNNTTISATIIRESSNSPFGIKYKVENDKVILTGINETSPFCDTSIMVGYELISINETNLVGLSVAEVKAILGSIETARVTVQARPVLKPCKFVFPLLGIAKGTDYHTPPMPSLFVSNHVPPTKWNQIFKMFITEIFPDSKTYLRMMTAFNNEMADFTGKQMTKGYIGFGQESHHEKKVFLMTNQTAAIHGNVVLMSSNVLAKSNALLNRHGIMVELLLEEKELRQYSTKQSGGANHVKLPVGLRFSSIE